ncbi:hypothetical protein PDJAM_G00253390 [Pangasius djambal]|uniref:Uncharacterized protein n=1 Tax=Pangasius djambal TaxID=1691987 RepID=A0ACC5YLX8_9TELE|nr:hypothetical protein [Pangasius djambal]
MPLTKEERIEIILMPGSGSCRKVVMDFNRKHGQHITHDTVAKLINKSKKTGSAADQRRSREPRTSTDDGTSDMVLTVAGSACLVSLRTEVRLQNIEF